MKCQHCQSPILRFRYSTKYCNNRCQNAAQNEKRRQAFLRGEFAGKHYDVRGWLRSLVEEVYGKKCAECGITDTYNGKPISLQVDHIDGIATNNVLENLRILCPNCHSQTPTYGARNKGRSTRVSRRRTTATAA